MQIIGANGGGGGGGGSTKSQAVVLNPVQLPPVAASTERERPTVIEQQDSEVTLAHAGSLALGAYLHVGSEHVGVVKSHRKGKAIIDLLYERTERGEWGAVLRAIVPGSFARPLSAEAWQELMRVETTDSLPVGRIRQPGSERVAAQMPPLAQMRCLVIGKSGAGKSTAMVTMLVEYANAIEKAWRERKSTANNRMASSTSSGSGSGGGDDGVASEGGLCGGAKPGIVVLDLHGDFLGRVRDPRTGRIRPSLQTSLEVEPEIIGPGTLYARGRDLPARTLVSCLQNLTSAQKRWADIYVQGDDDHAAIETLVLPQNEARWAAEFKELALDGELSRPVQQSLVTLRAKFHALLSEPLFKRGGEGTWARFLEQVRAGKCVVVDLQSFPVQQRAMLAVLVVRTLMKAQVADQNARRVLQPIVIAVDEAHALPEAHGAFEEAYKEARKLNIGMLLGSQRLAHFSAEVVTQATHAICLRAAGVDGEANCRRWSQLKPVKGQMPTLAPGDGFFVDGRAAWPVRFDEPPILRSSG